MLVFFGVIVAFILAVTIFVQLPKFGRLPGGDRKERIGKSPNFRNGAFQNSSPTPDLTEGVSLFSVLAEFIFSRRQRVKPTVPLPSQKTDLFAVDPRSNVLVYMGHSSYYFQRDGKRVLVDPVFSGAASPLAFTTRAFAGRIDLRRWRFHQLMLLPVHSAKFALANHSWDDPLVRIITAVDGRPITLLTPMIGERVELTESNSLTDWWKGIE